MPSHDSVFVLHRNKKSASRLCNHPEDECCPGVMNPVQAREVSFLFNTDLTHSNTGSQTAQSQQSKCKPWLRLYPFINYLNVNIYTLTSFWAQQSKTKNKPQNIKLTYFIIQLVNSFLYFHRNLLQCVKWSMEENWPRLRSIELGYNNNTRCTI